MEDYITILLNGMREQWEASLDSAYFLQEGRYQRAAQALRESLSESQADLLLRCEEEKNAAEALYETCMTRQAFLLAREIYR